FFSIRYWPIGAILGYGSDCAAALDIPQPMAMTTTKTIVSSGLLSSDLGLMSPPLSVTPCSACSVLSPALLACLHDFAHVPCWPNLENGAVRQSRMLADELDGMIHVPRLKDANAADLLLGFGIGTVGRRDFAILPRQGQGGFRTLKRFSTGRVPA